MSDQIKRERDQKMHEAGLDVLINPLRGMHWDSADPVIEALMDVVDAVNDLQRAHNGESPDWRIHEAWDRRRETIRRLAAISEQWDGSA